MAELFLTQSSIVLLARDHNIWNIDPHRLVDHGVVPLTWNVRECSLFPLEAKVAYEDGVTIEATAQRLTVGSLGDPSDVREVAVAYIRAFPRLAFGALGLNVQVAAKLNAEPHEWLRSQARPAETVPGSSVDSITLHGNFEGDVLFRIELNGGAVQRGEDDEPEDVVLIDFNIHHPSGLTVDALCEAIERWPDYLQFIDSTVKSLVGAEE